ncbi:hypothetical protein [Planctomicrobium sp. SH664]|uniref:hypothetical protein n=1 Tax=Planctomicrobium sp. SH664 TaxID=3448125 RepID=UPI003F5C4720
MQTNDISQPKSLHESSPVSAAEAVTPAADLPLTVFERFMLRHDTPDTPLVFRVIMRFHGPCQIDLLSAAYDRALARQPLLLSRLVQSSEREFAWSPLPHPPPMIVHPPTEDLVSPALQEIPAIDLRETSGLRTQVWTSSGGVLVLLDFHHACCDGQGARQFLVDWFWTYDQLCQQEPLRDPPYDQRLLFRRHQFQTFRAPIGLKESLRNLHITLRGRTSRLPRKYPPQSGRTAWLAEHSLSIDQTESLRQTLKQRQQTVNDLGLAATFAAFAECFPQQTGRRYITILNPVDLRRPSDARCPACNRLGVAILRRRANWNSFDELLASVRGEMQYVKQRYIGVEFLNGLALADSIPGAVALVERLQLLTPTIQFTCLGDTTRGFKRRPRDYQLPALTGELQLQEIAGFAPPVPRVPISAAFCETNNRLNLTVRCNARFLNQQETARFAESLLKHLLTAVGTP